MRRRYGRLPSMQALLCFEAAARLESFSRAAEELHMTQSAVSHQMRSLEEHVGQPLFRRLGRKVEPTDAGSDLLETTRRTLSTLSTGMSRLDFYVKAGSVILSCPPAWGRHWLLHRLPALRRQHPDIDPWIESTTAEVDFEHTESDCFVSLGDGHWPGFETVCLGPECLSPVCSPALAKKLGKQPSKARLAAVPLLHDEDWDGWNSWYREAGIDALAPVEGYNFSDPGLVIDSAIAGQGVALASLSLASHALSQKQLVQPFSTTLDTGLSWYLVGHKERLRRPEARLFWDWVLKMNQAEAALKTQL